MANGRGLCLVALVALFGLASGSHFRYGALFWEPTGNVRGWTDGVQAQVEFTLRAAFRRDYDWGANFGERWAQTSSQHTQKIFYGNEYFYKEYTTTNPGCDINAGANSEERALCFNCPTEVTGIDSTGITATAVGCVNSKPFFDAPPDASVDLNVTLYDDENDNGISGERFYIRFPPKKQDYPIEAEIVQCPDPFYCDILIQNEDGTWRDNQEQTDLCSAYTDNVDRDPNKCAPWAEVYGMYLGDDEGSSVEVEMSVTRVDHTGNPIIGNFLIGVGRFTHYYYENTATPYTAYFTGGDRIYECAEGVMDEYGRCLNNLDLMLNNNAEGRYRLESEVWIKSDIANRSPIISMIPILPVPRRPEGYRSKFQIAAYDPDRDTLRFRFGTTREMGGIMRSKSSAFPHSENDPPGPILPTVLKYGQFKCDTENKFYKLNQTCPTDRVPTRVPGVDEYSFDPDTGVPGLVEWTTHGYSYQYCPDKQGNCDDLRQGLYNMIVAVEDIPSNEVILQYTREGVGPENAYMSKSIVDFMVYLYDGPMYFCPIECTTPTYDDALNPVNAGIPTYANRDGIYGLAPSATCAVCGLGPSHRANTTGCTAGTGECSQDVDGVSVVPSGMECRENNPPVFTSQLSGGSVGDIVDTPEVDKWEKANEHLRPPNVDTNYPEFSWPSITQYFGEDIEFYVTAVDYDDCTDLVLESTGLPETRNAGSGTEDWRFARLEGYAYPTDPDNPGWTVVRRKFVWEAPPDADGDTDTRDEYTLVCFYAYDIYHATADPFYCVELNLIVKPSAEEQTIIRFDCKMGLLWSPTVRRFVYSDHDSKYYSICRYEDYMWHHAMVSINETGVGQLFIDGLPVELMIPLDPTDLSKGFDPAPQGTYFTSYMYPNRCTTRRRGLLESTIQETGVDHSALSSNAMGVMESLEDGEAGGRHLLIDGFNDNTDQPVSDSFIPVDTSINTPGQCCSFYIGKSCERGALNEFKTFAGFIDEVGVWNRPLHNYEIKSTIFKMPLKQLERTLEAPRGVQVDYTAGRVYYGRFNNPCMESPEQAPPPPSPPPPNTEGNDQTNVGRRLLQDDSPPAPPLSPFSGISRNLGNRTWVISDKAGYTAGSSDDIQSVITDIDNDYAVFHDFPENAKYAYTGVPWAQPMVLDVTTNTEQGRISLKEKEHPLPLDGGMKVLVHGVGFARSPYTKCINAQPDPTGLYFDDRGDGADTSYHNPEMPSDHEYYNNWFRNIPGKSRTANAIFSFNSTTQVMKTSARTVFEASPHIPNLGLYDPRHPAQEDEWVPSDDTREGNIPPFPYNAYDSHQYDYHYGFWEVLECTLPAAAFPSQDYYFGVSNDAGLTGSPFELTYTYQDYSIKFDGGSSFQLENILENLGNVFTISMWVYPMEVPDGEAVIMSFGQEDTDASVGVIYDSSGPRFAAVINGDAQTPNVNASALNEWHFVVLVVDETRISFYLDDVDDFSFGGGSSNREMVQAFSPSPTDAVFGERFVGAMDELKIWRSAMSKEFFTTSQAMFAREMPPASPDSTGVFAYYRFNNKTDTSYKVIKDEFGDKDGLGSGIYEYTAMAVPWEPTTLYTITVGEEEPVDVVIPEGEYGIMTAPQIGSKTLAVEGFNIASSQWTRCRWGEKEPHITIKLTVAPEDQPFQCNMPETEVDQLQETLAYDYMQELLGRPDNKSAVMAKYPAYRVEPTKEQYHTMPIAGTLNSDGTYFECVSPPTDSLDFTYVAAGNVPTFNSYPFEFTEVALYCDGDNYLMADAVSELVADSSSGYTFGAWVFPSKAGEMSRLTEEVAEDKNLRRRLQQVEMVEAMENREENSTVGVMQTVLAFESSEGDVKNNGLIMYDGVRFFYYDDCILDVTQTGANSSAEEWHFVMVSIDGEGEGSIMVDGLSVETFTTACRPAAGSFSVCQDYVYDEEGNSTMSTTFYGLVDEVMIFNTALTVPQMTGVMFKPYDLSAGLDANLVYYMDFAHPDNMLPLAAATTDPNMFEESNGPWSPAMVVEVIPSVTGTSSTKVAVYGTNFAPSQWLRVSFGGDHLMPGHPIPSGLMAETVAIHSHHDESPSDACEQMYDARVTNHLEVDSNSRKQISYNATTSDLYSDLVLRYTFDYTVDATMETEDKFQVFDYSGREKHFMYQKHYRVEDKDLIRLGAVEFGPSSDPIKLNMPDDLKEYTICAYLFMFISAQKAPYPGGWKLICLLKHENGDTETYVNNAHSENVQALPSDDETNAWYTAHLGDLVFGNQEEGYIDDLWVYSRLLLPCEIEKRFYTQEYSLDFTKLDMERRMRAPPSVEMPFPEGPLAMTLELWVFPYVSEGKQTFLATDMQQQIDNTTSAEFQFAFGLQDNSLSFAIYLGCSCQPCESFREWTSWKATIPIQQWSHVGITYGAMYPGAVSTVPTNAAAFLAMYVDGVLRDLQEYDTHAPVFESGFTRKVLLGQESTRMLNLNKFDGLLYDVRYTNSSYLAHQVKKTMQCQPKNNDEIVYIELNEGSGNEGASGALTMVEGLWTNSSYDDPTSPISTTFYGEMSRRVSGEVGRFTIHSRTACQKKRLVGGDDYTVSLSNPSSVSDPFHTAKAQPAQPATAEELAIDKLTILDTNDGNYHVEYKGLSCGTYAAEVKLGEEVLQEFDIEIYPGPTNPDSTYIIGVQADSPGSMITPKCFGVQTDFIIQTVDLGGCLKTDMDDTFNATFVGPYDFAADVTPLGSGQYRVSFMPEAPGDYQLNLTLTTEPGNPRVIAHGQYFCVQVCSEGSLQFAGGSGVIVQEDAPGITDLDLSFPEVTLELWYKIPVDYQAQPDSNIYLLHKGGSDQLGEYTKTYEMLISDKGELTCKLYVGNGEWRMVSSDVSSLLQETWYHVAAVYTGYSLSLYIGTHSAQTETFDTVLPVHTNSYDHPLEIGANFTGGFIDEVKLWKVARTLDEIEDTLYCSPYLEIEKLAAYFSFNEGSGDVISGHGDQCKPQGAEAIIGECMQGTLAISGNSSGVAATWTSDTPMTTSMQGFNGASPKYSQIFGPGLSLYHADGREPQYTIVAKDKCKYDYIADDANSFTARTKKYYMNYTDSRPPFGTEYPIEENEPWSESYYAQPPANAICPMERNPNDPPSSDGLQKGNVFTGYLQTTVSGDYYLQVAVGSTYGEGEDMGDKVSMTDEPFLLTIKANVPKTFSVAPTNDGLYAGVPWALKVQKLDRSGNVVYVESQFVVALTLLDTMYNVTRVLRTHDMAFDEESGTYTVFVTLGYAGIYSMVMTMKDADGTSLMDQYDGTFNVQPAPWRKLLTNDLSVPTPTKRFEHTSTVYNGDIYVFSGAQYDKTYLNDMYVLKNAEMIDGIPAVDESLAYKKTVHFNYSITEDKDLTVEVRVNTAELVAANRMNPTCLDVVFTMPNNYGEGLDFYLDPHPGCDSETTLYWVKLPAGHVPSYENDAMFEMYYGNPSIGPVVANDYNDPEKVFYFYEGFEAGNLSDSKFDVSGACTGGGVSNPNTFTVEHSYPYHGKYALYANPDRAGVLAASVPKPETNFKMRAWFYDSDATDSAHIISPDFDDCELADGDKPLMPRSPGGTLESISTAVGTYTLAHGSKYCVASPWESTSGDIPGTFPMMRSARYHMFEILSLDGKLTISIDEKPVKIVESGGVTLNKVLLSAGFGTDSVPHADLNSSHAFWDEISVSLVEPTVGVSEATSMADDEPVSMVEQRYWFKLETTSAPPPRYAHSSVVYNGTMYIFGGERSSFSFNDIWAFSLANQTWSYVTPATTDVPRARFDHVAAVTTDGIMVIYGGRNGLDLLSDMWTFHIPTSTWRMVSPSAGAGPRFGHAAAIPKYSRDTIYVFGGYTDVGFSGAFFKCHFTSGVCLNITTGCDFQQVADDFLPANLVHRYEHTMFADAEFLYIYGGASISQTDGYSGIFKYAIDECIWEELQVDGPPVGRYEHTAGLMEGGFYVHGGHSGGDYSDETLFFPL